MDNSYLAGFFDGEGCIGIRKTFRRQRKGKNVWHIANISCCQSNLPNKSPIILEFKKKFGGSITLEKPKKAKEVIRWSLQGRKLVETFLNNLEPYFIVKKPHTAILRLFLNENRTNHSPVRLTTEQINIREKLYLQMKELNQRGKIII